MKIALNYVYVSISGDYYQVSFDAKEEDGTDEITDDPYFLIQRQFEMSDGGKVYIESHDENYIGHFLVNRATLQMDKIYLELKMAKYSNIEYIFQGHRKGL